MSQAESRLFESVGRAILAWARFELQLHLLFTSLCGQDSKAATKLFDRMRSFDAKRESINDVASAVLTEEEQRDWALISAHITSCYRLRNKIAHGSMLQDADDPYIKPFYTPSSWNMEKLRSKDIDGFTEQFAELKNMVQWFTFKTINHRTQHPQLPEQEPDRIRHLRNTADQKREAQRHRDLAVRQYIDRHPELRDALLMKGKKDPPAG